MWCDSFYTFTGQLKSSCASFNTFFFCGDLFMARLGKFIIIIIDQTRSRSCFLSGNVFRQPTKLSLEEVVGDNKKVEKVLDRVMNTPNGIMVTLYPEIKRDPPSLLVLHIPVSNFPTHESLVFYC